jgi:uncharacterized protein
LAVGKSGILENLPTYLPRARRWIPVALGIGIVGNGLLAYHTLQENALWAVIGMTIGAPAFSFVYATLIASHVQRLKWLAPMGQMALTNYLMQSVLCTTLFYGYGFGLYGEISPMGRIALTLVIWGSQVVVSGWWMKHFRFGPMEWVWRSLTYGVVQPIRRPMETMVSG